MMNEIEKKFLVPGDFPKHEAIEHCKAIQGYLMTAPGKTLRVRRGWWFDIKTGEVVRISNILAYKYKDPGSQFTRLEYEYEIPHREIDQLLKQAIGTLVTKERFRLHSAVKDIFWDVDVFHGDNAGLKMAEIEIPDEKFEIEIPPWCGKEVTHDSRYYNDYLAKCPINTWEQL